MWFLELGSGWPKESVIAGASARKRVFVFFFFLMEVTVIYRYM